MRMLQCGWVARGNVGGNLASNVVARVYGCMKINDTVLLRLRRNSMG